MLYTPYKFPKSNVVGLNESLSEKTDLSVIADEFDATATYAKNDYVIYNGLLYKCTTAHTGVWSANDFTATLVGDELGSGGIADLSAVAPTFSSSTSYAVGTYVTYEGKLYKCTTAHSGDWNANDFTETSVNASFMAKGRDYVTAGLKSGTTLAANATAEGGLSTASAQYAHCEAYSNTASGIASHAEGTGTTASENGCHTEGTQTVAEYQFSHAEGKGTKTGKEFQHVQGMYNVGKSTTAFEIGKGTADNARSNAFEVDWSGNVVASGSYTDGTGNPLVNQTVVGTPFSTSTAYSIGDVVTYNGNLYRFTSAHSAGAWNSSHVTQINIGDQIENFKEVIVTVPTSAWSSSQTSGYYTATITTPEFSTAVSPSVSCAGASMTATPTAEQMAAYRNIQNPNGYIEQVSSTSIKLYAKTKPTAAFYIKLSGYGIGVQLDSCQSATVANQVQSNLDLRLFRFSESSASGVAYSYNGSSIKKLYFVKTKVNIYSGSWSSSANSDGYYTYNISNPTFRLETTYQPNIYCVGQSASIRPTAAQIAAYRNICEPNGYVDCTSASMTLYAKTKPTTTFYIVVEGMYFA